MNRPRATAPRRPCDPRPGGKPYFVPAACEECGVALVCVGAKAGWHDEFECPSCMDGIVLDLPPGVVKP